MQEVQQREQLVIHPIIRPFFNKMGMLFGDDIWSARLGLLDHQFAGLNLFDRWGYRFCLFLLFSLILFLVHLHVVLNSHSTIVLRVLLRLLLTLPWLFGLLLCLFLVWWLRLHNLFEFPSTLFLMLPKPRVSSLRLPVHSSSHISKVWWHLSASSGASPNMLSVDLNLIVEAVVDSHLQSCCCIDFSHHFLEWRTVSTVHLTAIWIHDE